MVYALVEVGKVSKVEDGFGILKEGKKVLRCLTLVDGRVIIALRLLLELVASLILAATEESCGYLRA